MAWQAPLTRATGDLITAAIWNGEHVNDLAWLASLATASKTGDVTNGAGTFATGTDVFASALSFTADGSSDYLFEFYAAAVTHTQASSLTITCNLDSADGGLMYFANVNAGLFLGVGLLRRLLTGLSAGVHTVNARIFSGAGTTMTLKGGAGGAGVFSPIIGRVVGRV